MTADPWWHCKGCGRGYMSNLTDLIGAHTRTCDYTDGDGEPIMVTVKWSEVHWYIASVPASDLAEAGHGRRFREMTGYDLDDDETNLLDFIAGLDKSEAEVDGVEIGDLYDSALDKPKG